MTEYHIPKSSKCIVIKDLGKLTINGRTSRYCIVKCPRCEKERQANWYKIRDRRRTFCKPCSCISHGMTKTRLYKTWGDMKRRCDNLNCHNYKDYGGRGITYCAEWKSFESFKNWALSNGYTDDLTIDRIENNGNYEPENCRFIGMLIQSRNTRRIQSDNTSGYRGITLDKKVGDWISQITVNRKRIHLGKFPTRREAARAYDKYVIRNNLEHTTNGLVK